MKIRYYELARQVSRHSSHAQHHLGSVLVKKGRVINVGYNEGKGKTHPKSPSKWKSIHSEFSCLLGVDFSKTIGSEVYTVRTTNVSPYMPSAPCSDCIRLMKYLGIKLAHYVDKNKQFNFMRIS